MSQENKKQFGLLRSVFWPVHRSEVKKVLAMLFLLFLLCVSYGVLRNLKDAIILTAKHSGAEVIPFIKVWGMLPGVFLATWFYTRLRRYFKKEHVFYILITTFIAYFLLFAFYLYPHCEQLHLEKVGNLDEFRFAPRISRVYRSCAQLDIHLVLCHFRTLGYRCPFSSSFGDLPMTSPM